MYRIVGWVDFGRDLRAERAAVDAVTATMTCRGPAGDLTRAGYGSRHTRLSVTAGCRSSTSPEASSRCARRERLAEAYAADPRLPGMMAIRPRSTAPAAFLLDINRWLERSGATIR